MNRRTIFLLLAMFAILPGCKKSVTSSASSGTKQVRLFIPSEYVPQEVIDGFTQETKIPVTVEVFDNNEAMLTKLSPGSTQYDVLLPSDYAVEHLIRRNMLAELDRTQVTNIGNVLPEYQNPPYDPGLKHSVPYMSGVVGIVINTDEVKDPVTGFKDVFSEKYAGRIVAVKDDREIVSWALAVQKIAINDVTPENLAKVKPMIADWVKRVKVFSTEPKQALLSGDVDLGIVYNGDAAALVADKKFRFVLPVEGTHRFVDNLCVPSGSSHKEEAHAFINYVLRPDISKKISDKFPYTNPNGAARKILSDEQRNNLASYPADISIYPLFRDIGKANGDISAMMTEIRGK